MCVAFEIRMSTLQEIKEPTIIDAVLEEFEEYKQFLKRQITLHMKKVAGESGAVEETPIPLELLPLLREYHSTLHDEADLKLKAMPQEPRSQVNNFIFDIVSYEKLKAMMPPEDRAKMARLEQLTRGDSH